jgi:hypothetical protein
MRLDASHSITNRAERLRWGDRLRPPPQTAPKCPIRVRVARCSASIPRRRCGAAAFAAPRLNRCNRRPSVTVGIIQLALEHKQSFLEDEQRHITLRNLLASFTTQLVQR